MSEPERDEELGEALARLPVPEPEDEFWDALGARCAEAFKAAGSWPADHEVAPHPDGRAAPGRPGSRADAGAISAGPRMRGRRLLRPWRGEGVTGPPEKPTAGRRRRTGHVLVGTPSVMTVAAVAVVVTLAGSLWVGVARRAEAVSVVPLSSECGRDGNAPVENGPRLVVAGVWQKEEADNFVKVLEDFKKRNGAGVIYAYVPTVRDMAPELKKRIENGCPPDVAFLPQLGLLRDLAHDHSLRPLEGRAAQLVKENYDTDTAAGRQFGVVDNVLYGVWFKAANKSMIWYRPDAFAEAGVEPPKSWEELKDVATRIRDRGLAPFSVAGADGWTLTDWFENVYLATAGPEMYDRLATRAIPWTDPSVKEALTTLAEILGRPEWIAGGTDGALQTTYETSVAEVLGPAPEAAMVYEGDFVAGTARDIPEGTGGETLKSFDFPAIGGSKPLVVGGDVAVSLTNNDAGKKLMEFLATPDAAEVWAKEGGFLSPNKRLDPGTYPDDATRSRAEALTQDQTWRFDLSDVQPSGFGASDGMWQLFRDFLRNPGDVDGLAEKLEEKARTVWGPSLTAGPAFRPGRARP
jgi:alpha-glucoside transport system substrate-binding protein